MKSHCVSLLVALRPEGPRQKRFPYQIPSHSTGAVRPQGDWCAITVGQKLLRWEPSTGSPGGPDRPTRATPPGRSALGLAGWPGRCSERRREEPGAPATQNHRARSPAAVAALTAARARCLHGALHPASRIPHPPRSRTPRKRQCSPWGSPRALDSTGAASYGITGCCSPPWPPWS